MTNITLPKRILKGSWADFEKFGVRRIEASESSVLFVEVVLPFGWSQETTDHSMWSKLTDQDGRVRAFIFNDDALSLADAFVSLANRYTCGVVYDDPINCGDSGFCFAAKDGSEILFKSESVTPPSSFEERGIVCDYFLRKDELQKEVHVWLDNTFPDWENVTAYWS